MKKVYFKSRMFRNVPQRWLRACFDSNWPFSAYNIHKLNKHCSYRQIYRCLILLLYLLFKQQRRNHMSGYEQRWLSLLCACTEIFDTLKFGEHCTCTHSYVALISIDEVEFLGILPSDPLRFTFFMFRLTDTKRHVNLIKQNSNKTRVLC